MVPDVFRVGKSRIGLLWSFHQDRVGPLRLLSSFITRPNRTIGFHSYSLYILVVVVDFDIPAAVELRPFLCISGTLALVWFAYKTVSKPVAAGKDNTTKMLSHLYTQQHRSWMLQSYIDSRHPSLRCTVTKSNAVKKKNSHPGLFPFLWQGNWY